MNSKELKNNIHIQFSASENLRKIGFNRGTWYTFKILDCDIWNKSSQNKLVLYKIFDYIGKRNRYITNELLDHNYYKIMSDQDLLRFKLINNLGGTT